MTTLKMTGGNDLYMPQYTTKYPLGPLGPVLPYFQEDGEEKDIQGPYFWYNTTPDSISFYNTICKKRLKLARESFELGSPVFVDDIKVCKKDKKILLPVETGASNSYMITDPCVAGIVNIQKEITKVFFKVTDCIYNLIGLKLRIVKEVMI